MARGAIAKTQVEDIIAKAFGDKYIGTFDKKMYVWADDGGEQVQISIALTCPKVPIGADAAQKPATLDFETNPAFAVPAPAAAEITPEETANLQELLKKLGL